MLVHGMGYYYMGWGHVSTWDGVLVYGVGC